MAVRFGGSTSSPFVTSVSSNGRQFLDQTGQPLLVHGDSPWSMAIDISNSDADWYFQQRQSQGFNAALFSAFGGEGTGGSDSVNFKTYDGVAPFVNGNLSSYNATYWSRLDGKIQSAQQHGITVFLYVMDTFGENSTFVEYDQDHSPSGTFPVTANYCSFVANRYKNSPNVVYMLGGDYDNYIPGLYGGDMDRMIQACAGAIKTAAPSKLLSIQLTGFPQSNSFDYSGWTTRPDFSFTYTYNPSYDATLRGYNHTWAAGPTTRPALYMEGPYEDENNKNWPQGATNLTLRKQMLWAILSGSTGDFYGRGGVWQFDSGWQTKVSTSTGVTQLQKLHNLVAGTAWQTLVPDQSDQFVTNGKGTPNTQGGTGTGSNNVNVDPTTNTYATAAFAPDGSLGLVYVPTARTLTLNTAKLASGYTAQWVDPTNATNAQPATVNGSGQVTTPSGTHSDGTSDWVLVVRK